MFTTGSKLFLGATVVALVGTLLFWFTNGGDAGLFGRIVLFGVLVAFAALAVANQWNRDGNQTSMAEEHELESVAAAARRPAGRNVGPLLAAIGALAIVIGAQTRPLIAQVGVIVLLLAGAEWLVAAYAERASADQAYNTGVYRRLMQPWSMPLVAAVTVGIVAYSFSRILLGVSKGGSVLIFAAVALLVVLAGIFLARGTAPSRGLVTGVATLAVLGLAGTGVAMALKGERHIERHPTTFTDPAICTDPAPNEEVDHRSPRHVSILSNPAAVVVAQNGQLRVFSEGFRDTRADVTVARGGVSNFLFRNLDAAPRRFTINLGKFSEPSKTGSPTVKQPKMCTAMVEPGGEALLTVRFERPSDQSEEPYTVTVPGLAGQAIQVIVP